MSIFIEAPGSTVRLHIVTATQRLPILNPAAMFQIDSTFFVALGQAPGAKRLGIGNPTHSIAV